MEKKAITFFDICIFLFLIFTVKMSDAVESRKEAGNLNISAS